LTRLSANTFALFKAGGKKIVFNNQSVKSYRAFAKFLALYGLISEDFANEILKELKSVETQSDLRVPTLDDIKRTLQLAKDYSENVYLVYRIALESGSKLSEILRVLKDPSQDICDGSICYYPLSWRRGYKGVFYVFHITPLRKVDITRYAIANFERCRDAIAIKYFRKFVATKMAELGIPLDVIDFIQGRKPTCVLTQHYVSFFGIAKEQYKKCVESLTKYA
jgi:intergrase/recombinase